jgi:hypothetical protein
MLKLTKKTRTLKDKLSRLTYTQACKLLGENGRSLIMQGGHYEIDFEDTVHLDNERFTLQVDGAVVSITLSDKVQNSLDFQCDSCDRVWQKLSGGLARLGARRFLLQLP